MMHGRKKSLFIAITIMALSVNMVAFAGNETSSEKLFFENAIVQEQKKDENSILTDENLTEIIKSSDFKIANNQIELSYTEPVAVKDSMDKSLGNDTLYKSTTVYFIPNENGLNELVDNINTIRSNDQENYRTDKDNTSSIRGYISVFFNYVTLGGNEFIDLTSVSGGYEVLDGSVSVRAQSVYIAQNGRTYEHGYKTQTTDRGVSGTSWALTPSSNWYPIQTGVGGTLVGANYTFTMTRSGGKYWSHTIYNSVESNPLG